MKNAGLVVLAVLLVVAGWRLVEVTREKTAIEERARTQSEELQARLEAAGEALEQAQSARDAAAERAQRLSAERSAFQERAQELEAELERVQAERAAVVEALSAERAALEGALAERSAETARREEQLQASELPTRDDVRDLQRRLSALGFDAGPDDGLLGSLTRQALLAFQRANGLPSTGEPDAGTRAAIVSLSGKE